MLAQTPCREFANRWEPKDYFIISAIGLPASATFCSAAGSRSYGLWLTDIDRKN